MAALTNPIILDAPQNYTNPPSVEKTDPALPQRILDMLKSGNFTQNQKQLIQDFTLITPEQLHGVLNQFFEEKTESFGEEEQINRTMHQLAEIIPFEKLEKAVCGNEKSALQKAKSLLHQAKYYLENTTKATQSIHSKISDLVDSLIAFIETILSAFGISDFFEPSATIMQSQFKFQKITSLVGFSSLLTNLLLPVLGATIAGPLIGGILLLIGVLSLIYPHISPVPSHLPLTSNWTKLCNQMKLGDLSLVKGRKDILDEMAKTLIKNQEGEMKKHCLLLGKSRVGKTQTVKAFVYAIERGDYPELKGKKVFYVNTAKLLKMGDFLDNKDPLEQIAKAMGRHKDQIILVLDEIHTAFPGEKSLVLSPISQKLKEMLDTNGDFPNVIGITTSAEFTEHISKDVAFVNRFNPITIGNTGPKVTQEILSHHLLMNGKSVLCEKNTLKTIYEKTSEKNLPQPYSARLVLDECIARASQTQNSKLKADKLELENQKEFLASQAASGPLDIDNQDDVDSQIEEIIKKIDDINVDLVKESTELKHLLKVNGMIGKVKAETYKTVLKTAQINEKVLSTDTKTQLNSFMLMSRILYPALEKYVKDQSKKMGLKMVIDETLIKEVITAQEELELKKVQGMQEANQEKKAAQEILK